MNCLAMAEHERIIMSKYTEEFRHNAIELMKKVGITKACKELKVSHCTIYRWCKEFEGSTPEQKESVETDLNAMFAQNSSEIPHDGATLSDSDADDTPDTSDTIATAMAMLVIENTQLREVIKHLRETISGLSDHILL